MGASLNCPTHHEVAQSMMAALKKDRFMLKM
jgi:hypothetical protein